MSWMQIRIWTCLEVGTDSIGTSLNRVTEEEESDYTYSKVTVTQWVALALHSWEQIDRWQSELCSSQQLDLAHSDLSI